MGAWVRGGSGGQGGWEQRSEACVEMKQKKNGGAGASGCGGSGWM